MNSETLKSEDSVVENNTAKQILKEIKTQGQRLRTFIRRVKMTMFQDDPGVFNYNERLDTTIIEPTAKKEIPTDGNIQTLLDEAALFNARSENIQERIVGDKRPAKNKSKDILTKVKNLDRASQDALIIDILDDAFQHTELFQKLEGTAIAEYIKEGLFLRTIDGRSRIDIVNGKQIRYGQILLLLKGSGGQASIRKKEITIANQRSRSKNFLEELLSGEMPYMLKVLAHEYMHILPGGSMEAKALAEGFAKAGEPGNPSEEKKINALYSVKENLNEDGTPKLYPGMQKISFIQAIYHISDLQLMGYSMSSIGKILQYVAIDKYTYSFSNLTYFVEEARKKLGYSETDLQSLAKERDARYLRDMAYLKYTSNLLLYNTLTQQHAS